METKPAVYTTEFWFHLIGQILLWLNTTNAWQYFPGKWGHLATAIASAILGLGYFTSRGIAKNKGTFDANNPLNFKFLPHLKKHAIARREPVRRSSSRVRVAPPATPPTE